MAIRYAAKPVPIYVGRYAWNQTIVFYPAKKSVIPLLFLTVCASSLIQTGVQIRHFNTFVDWISFYFIFAYIPFIYFFQLICKK